MASSVDNGLMQKFCSTTRRELLDRHDWDTQAELGSATFEWIESFYIPRRRHSGLGYLSPIELENQHTTIATAA